MLVSAAVPSASAQDGAPGTLRFRSGAWQPPVASAPLVSGDGPRHEILQFDDAVDRARVESLAAAGVRPLRFIPDNAVLVGTDGPSDLSSIAGLRWRGALPPAAKVSLDTRAWMQSSPAQASLQVITMHPDVARADAEALVATLGGVVDDRASLGGAVVLARVTREAIGRLADADAVAWIVPANEAMA
ncbi:MAG: hypothetical protein JNM38_19305, partial [Acidobacteria bacterium]|nr:hypothetical protein [Acidobacteriota bacterium]